MCQQESSVPDHRYRFQPSLTFRHSVSKGIHYGRCGVGTSSFFNRTFPTQVPFAFQHYKRVGAFSFIVSVGATQKFFFVLDCRHQNTRLRQ
jgi:hypothetical protein